METKRQDIYTSFHKLLRSRLFEASVRLGRMDFTTQDDADGTLAFVEETLELLFDHAAQEDEHVQRILHAYGDDLAAELDREHVALEEGMRAIRRIASDVPGPSAADRVRRGQELYARFNALVAEQVAHMGREEREANAVLWANLTDGEIAALRQAIIQSQAPARTAWIIERLLPLWSMPERAGMWRETRAHAPAAVATMVQRVGERVLGAAGWAQVERAAGATP